MKTAKEYFESLLSTDANCPIDKYAHKFTINDLFKFAESYHRQFESDPTETLRQELIDYDEWYFKHLPVADIKGMDKSIEKIVDKYLLETSKTRNESQPNSGVSTSPKQVKSKEE